MAYRVSRTCHVIILHVGDRRMINVHGRLGGGRRGQYGCDSYRAVLAMCMCMLFAPCRCIAKMILQHLSRECASSHEHYFSVVNVSPLIFPHVLCSRHFSVLQLVLSEVGTRCRQKKDELEYAISQSPFVSRWVQIGCMTSWIRPTRLRSHLIGLWVVG